MKYTLAICMLMATTSAIRLNGDDKKEGDSLPNMGISSRVALDAGWKMIRCEAYDGLRWKNLHGWGGPPATKISPPPGVGRGVKRKRGGSNKIVDNSSSSGSDARSVVVDGEQYTTLPDFLSKTPMKSQKQVADKCAGEGKVEIRGGNSTSLVAFSINFISSRSFFTSSLGSAYSK